MNATKTFIALFITSIIMIWGNYKVAQTNTAQPLAGHTGAPGEPTCATIGCHGGTASFNPTTLKIGTAPLTAFNSGYSPGQQYFMTVTLNHPSSVFGFSITALDENNTPAGTLELGTGNNPDFTSLSSLGGKQYIGHKNASGTNAWTFRWTAPASDIGPVTFYAAGNASNGDGTANGSNVFTSTFKVTTDGIANSIYDNYNTISNVNVYPNPATDYINITMDAVETGTALYELFDVKGQLVERLTEYVSQGDFVQTKFEINNQLAPGLYVLKISLNDKNAFHKISFR